MRKLGYAVLGLGIGMAHAAGAAESANAELVAACDLDEARLTKFGALYPDAVRYTDADALSPIGRSTSSAFACHRLCTPTSRCGR